MKKKRNRKPQCLDCYRPLPRWGRCDDCKALGQLLLAIHRDEPGEQTEAEQIADREAIHRARSGQLRDYFRGKS